MNGILTTSLFLWLIVYPVLLFAVLLIYRELYQILTRWKKRRRREKALERLQDRPEENNH